MDTFQRDNAQTMIGVANGRGVNQLGKQALLCIGWGENDLRANGCNNSGHCGIFQLDGTWQAMHDYHDVAYWTGFALDHGFYSYGGIKPMSESGQGLSPGDIANRCQGAYADLAQGAAYYNGYLALANQTLAQLDTGAGGFTGPPAAPPPAREGLIVARYNPSTIIRHDAFVLGEHGRRAFAGANTVRELISRVDLVTMRGPRSG